MRKMQRHIAKEDMNMSQFKKLSRAGLRVLTFCTASFRARSFRLDALRLFSPRFMTLAALSLSLAFLGNCGGCGSSGGGGGSGSSGGTPSCTGSEILQNEQCEECTAPQFPNADRTACVANCPDGEYKPMKKPTCEVQVTCTGREIHNPKDNSCFVLNCDEGEIADTTASPPNCIKESDCRAASGKLLNVDGRSCITEAACTSVENQLINESGDCEACSGDKPVRNVDKTACISVDECQTGSSGAYSLLGEANCVTDGACQDMPGHVATVDGVCQACTGEDSIRNMEKTACMSIGDCQSLSENAFSVLNDAECITDAACIAASSRVATTDGVCETCTGDDSIRNMEKTACMSAQDCQSLSDNAFSVLEDAECITDAACIAMPDRVATADGDCQTCSGDAPDRNAARSACGVDGDSDGVFDNEDAFPTMTCASRDSDNDGLPDTLLADCNTNLIADACPQGATGSATSADPDPDNDGCKNSEDVDDDNDGLIEIATASELDNIRHDLAGASYKTSSTADPVIAGAPESATSNCAEAVGYHVVDATGVASLASGSLPGGSTLVSAYLCGYELTADIDLAADDQDSADDDSNFEPITGAFTAILDGNGRAINNMQITKTNDDDANASFIDNCNGSVIRNLHIQNAAIASTSDASSHIHVSFLCAGAGHSTWHKTRIIAVRAQGSLSCSASHSSAFCGLGGLVAGITSTTNSGFLITGSMVQLTAS